MDLVDLVESFLVDSPTLRPYPTALSLSRSINKIQYDILCYAKYAVKKKTEMVGNNKLAYHIPTAQWLLYWKEKKKA